ncbi:serine/threonine-protein kinase [Priestia flexa]|uniref:kinase n=1 Tax=Priestia flexa TaxID=86664 RepID=UPI000955E1D7|nr:kinase [Priestia flexa]MBY6086362.1 kinase [Priestia flexa]MEC0665624.1 kinase [Priestia flexa]MED3825303.1 kinase [Priestia flexa]WEZ07212.1 kinase [Priestia flexa]SIQ77495.1 hypothetical protein SAMN05880580_108176 [Priestia flexa]
MKYPLIRQRRISFSSLHDHNLIGSGKDGQVYHLKNGKCIKIYYNEATQQKELQALKLGQSSSVIPRIYEAGYNYIILEYIESISLARYIKRTNSLPFSLVKEIILLLDELQRVGFTRWDAEVRHILITKDGHLKVIDLKRALTSDTKVPTKLFQGLEKLGVLDLFFKHLRDLRPDLHLKWSSYQ